LVQLIQTGGEKVRSERQKADEKLLQQQVDFEGKQHASANKFHAKQLTDEVEHWDKLSALANKFHAQQDARAIESNGKAAAARALDHAREEEVEQQWLAMLEKAKEKQLALEAAFNQRTLKLDAEREAARALDLVKEEELAGRWLVMLDASYEKALALEAAFNRGQAKLGADRLAQEVAQAEHARSLNTRFLTSSIPSQIHTAEQAAVYTSLGGNAAEKYGTAAAAADLAALRAQYAATPGPVRASQEAIKGHNHTMEEAHGLARGLAGSLGGLWLTYGSLIPLAAGAALAASMKNVVEVGKDVQYQLSFVSALSNGNTVPLDDFLRINDGTLTSVRDAAGGLRILAQNGLNVKQALDALPEVLNLAVVGETNVEQAALAATGAMAAFNLKVSDLGHIGDVLQGTAASSNTSVTALNESLRQASQVASVYKVSLEETAAALGTLAKANITGGQAGTAFTNLLTNLYTPTQQGARALKELGVSATTASGQLKNSTQLLDELRIALSKYNQEGQASFLNDIATNRGAKAAGILLQFFDEYKERIEHAKYDTGVMSDAVARLEDNVEGSFKRLKNSADQSFTKAFETIAPSIQETVNELAHLARSDGAVVLLTRLGDITVQVTKFLIDHGAAIATVVAGYGAMRLAISTWTAASAALATYHKAAVAAAEAQAALAAAQAAGTAVTTASATAFAGWAAAGRAALGFLGPIGIALGVATVAYQLLNREVDTTLQQDLKLRNSIEGNIETMEREIKALKEKREARLLAEGKSDDIPTAPSRQNTVNAEVDLTVAQQRLQNLKDTFKYGTPQVGGTKALNDVREAEKALAEARRLEWKEVATAEDLYMRRSEENTATRRQRLIEEIELFAKRGEIREASDGSKVLSDAQGNEISREIAAGSKQIAADLKNNIVTFDQAAVDFEQKKQQYSSALTGRAAKQDNDAIKAWLEQIELGKQLYDIRNKTALIDLDAQHKAGAVGDLDYLRQKLVLEKDALAQAAVTAQQEALAVKDADKKQAAYQKFFNLVQTSLEKTKQLQAQETIAEKSYMDDLKVKNLASEAENYEKKGELVNAYLSKFQASYGREIAKLENDLSKVDMDTLEQALAVDPKNEANLRKFNLAMEQTLRLQNLLKGKDLGEFDASFSEKKTEFDKQLSEAQSKLATIKGAAAEDGGLSGALGLGQAAQDIQTQLLPALTRAADQLKAMSEQPGASDAIQKMANDATTAVGKLQLEVAKSADPFGNAWTEMWKSFGKEAHNAWNDMGKKGESIIDRLGKMLRNQILEALWQLQAKPLLLQVGSFIGSAYNAGVGQAESAGTAGTGGAGSVNSLISAVNTANTVYKGVAGVGGTITGLGNLIGSSTISSFGTGMSLGTSGVAEAVAAYNAAGMTGVAGSLGAGASLSGGISAAIAAIPGWGWAALGAAAIAGLTGWFDDGPEQNTHLRFTSNNAAGNISINERGNEGKTNQSYIDNYGTGAFGTFGVSASLWMSSAQQPVQDFISTVTKTDDVLSKYLTATERTTVTSAITGKTFTAETGAEGSNPNATGQLDQVFAQRMQAIFASIEPGLDGLITSFKGTSQELATEAETLLQFRSQLAAAGETLFGAKVTLQELAGLRTPTESAGDAIKRLVTDFEATNKVAAALGKTTAEAFGAVGLSSYAARQQLLVLAGGADALTQQVSSFAQNYLSEAERIAPVSKALDEALASLSLQSIPQTRDQFKDLVQGLDLTDVSQAKLFVSLMQLQDAFAQVHPVVEAVAKTVAQIASERQNLQSQLDAFLPEADQLTKQRDALDASNRALFDQIQAHKSLQEAYDNESQSLQEAIDKNTSFANSLKKFRDNLVLGDLSPLKPLERYAEARQQYMETLAKARAGDSDAQSNYESAARAFLEASRTANASDPQYTSDFNLVKTATMETASWAEDQVDVAKDSLEQLKAQVSGLVKVETAVMSVHDAIMLLAAAGGATGDNATSIENLYQSILGRTSDTEGKQFWMNALNSGVSLENIAGQFQSSPENQIEDLYRNILGRAPDQQGLQFWMQALQNGVSIDHIKQEFYTSPEYLSTHQAVQSYEMSAAQQTAATQSMTQQIATLTAAVNDLNTSGATQNAELIQAVYGSAALNAEQTVEGTTDALSSAAYANQQQVAIV
jgi:TP901 family phage tail tape measure protein